MTVTPLDPPGPIGSRVETIDFTATLPVVAVSIEFNPDEGNGARETAYDGTDESHANGTFSHRYRNSTIEGNTWHLRREGGWPGPFQLRVKEASVLPPAGTPPLYGPLGLWPLDGAPNETLVRSDRSGYGRNLTSGNALAVADMVEGRTAAQPVGSTRLQRTADAALQLRGAMTLTMRAKRNVDGDGVLVCMSAPYGPSANRSLYVLRTYTDGRFDSYLDNVPPNVTDAARLDAGIWRFVTFRRAEDLTETIGVDGIYESFPSRGPITDGTNAYLVIGDHEEPSLFAFEGAIADVAIWDKRLTDEQLEHVRHVTMGIA